MIKQRLQRLDSLLVQSEWLWRPQPYKLVRPVWCVQRPQLCDSLLALSEQQLLQLAGDQDALLAYLTPMLPELLPLQDFVSLPLSAQTPLLDQGPHFISGIPGRKWQQVTRFAAAVGPVSMPLLEWCGGKGHLGRLLAAQWHTPVKTIEHNAQLCAEGERFARKAKVEQRFYRLDALSAAAGLEVAGHHAVALHACGELHRNLLREAVRAGVDAFDIAPCCYYIGAGRQYHPFTPSLQLQLSRDDLRLAVTETVTAAGREVARRDQEMAWKLGYAQLYREVSGAEEYRPIKPIVKQWLTLGFEGFCRQLAAREGDALPQDSDWSRYEALGWQRQREVMRLSLVRAAFRRSLEMWLVLDMANYMATHGYTVRIATFCARELTPRNILLSARRHTTVSGVDEPLRS